MGDIIIKQPNGLYALWSTVVDDFIALDYTPEDIIDEWVEYQARLIRSSVELIIADQARGITRYTWDDRIRFLRTIHGQKRASDILMAIMSAEAADRYRGVKLSRPQERTENDGHH